MSGFCGAPANGGATATFNAAVFQTGGRYPEFNSVSPTLMASYYAEAGLYLNNSGYGPVSDSGVQSLIMNMVTAHIAALYAGVNGQPASPLVGRVSNAAEGSVSVATDMGAPAAGTQAWFQQTTYGASAYAALAPYRRGQYVPGRQSVPGYFGSRFPWMQ